MDTITPVTQYIEAHLQRITSNFLSDGDILNMLGGEGGVQVDVVFYLVSNRMAEHLRRFYEEQVADHTTHRPPPS